MISLLVFLSFHLLLFCYWWEEGAQNISKENQADIKTRETKKNHFIFSALPNPCNSVFQWSQLPIKMEPR
jgi:hypothetical protein